MALLLCLYRRLIGLVSYNQNRATLDKFAASSFQKAEAAQKAGHFKSEIVPVIVEGKPVTKDDGIRSGVTSEVMRYLTCLSHYSIYILQTLGKLKPAFKPNGCTTAGNASQLTDGAAAVMLARRSVAKKLGVRHC